MRTEMADREAKEAADSIYDGVTERIEEMVKRRWANKECEEVIKKGQGGNSWK